MCHASRLHHKNLDIEVGLDKKKRLPVCDQLFLNDPLNSYRQKRLLRSDSLSRRNNNLSRYGKHVLDGNVLPAQKAAVEKISSCTPVYNVLNSYKTNHNISICFVKHYFVSYFQGSDCEEIPNN